MQVEETEQKSRAAVIPPGNLFNKTESNYE